MNKGRMTSRLRIQIVGLLMLLGMGALAVRLWWIQVAHGTEWTAQLRGSLKQLFESRPFAERSRTAMA
jgi:hypothetical protein